MHWTALLEKRTFPPHARITGDLACIGCGYNLRGAQAAGNCPECGLTVGASLYELARPDEVAAGFRGIARSFLFVYVALVPLFIPTMVGMDMTLLAGTALWVGSVFRLYGATKLRFGASLAQLPVVGAWMFAGWVTALIDMIFLTVALIMWYVILVNPAGFAMAGAAWKQSLVLGWLGLTIINLWLSGRMGAAMARMLDYHICRRELMIQQILIAAGPVLAFVLTLGGLALVVLSGKGVTSSIIVVVAAGALCLVWLLGAAYTTAALSRLAGAAEQEREPLDKLVDLERSVAEIPRAPVRDEPDVPLA